MTSDRYYQSELYALRQLGRRFAERSPALAPFLGQSGQDPDVERLLEGFAFLTGRLRQKIDDDIPELSHSLVRLLWPNYLQPLPAFSILQFDPSSRVGPAFRVARDTPVQSGPVDGVACQFRTCYPTDVQALRLAALDDSTNGSGSLLSLRLELTADGDFGDLQLQRVRLHFTGERCISQTLYLNLLRHLDGVELTPLDAANHPLPGSDGAPLTFHLRSDCVQPVGFAEEEALVPYPLNTFRGYRHLQEYFAFQDKFLFVDISGFQCLKALSADVLGQVRGLTLRCLIRRPGVPGMRSTLDNVKLHCTPIVNLFAHDAVPVRIDGKQDEYRLQPAGHDPQSCEIFSVQRVTGWKPGGQGHEDYVAFESFEHDLGLAASRPRPHYSVRQRTGMLQGGIDTYVSVGHRSAQAYETLSIELMCTNHNLPRRLRVGDIDRPCEQTPERLSFRNITPATASFAPPLDRDLLWKLISNMSLNYLSLANVNALKVILETYDLPRYHDPHAEKISRRLLGGLQSIRHEPVDRLHRGLPVRGVRTELTIDPGGYIGDGDLFVFASVLNEFFALYASLNSFHQLRVQSTKGEVYQWTPRMGLQPLL